MIKIKPINSCHDWIYPHLFYYYLKTMRNIFRVTFCKYILIFGIAPTLSFANEIISEKVTINDADFVQEINKNSVPFSKYDSPLNQFTDFFGLKADYEDDEQINYQDLSVIVDSKNTRNIYYRKLENMTRNKSKNTNSFFKGNL